ncbi:MAG TPA: hypothetical protein VMV79_08555, partial [Alphaproteobacteria bacterium]|nr:hypothetical protein [Alphaproteobacteria bacterium]
QGRGGDIRFIARSIEPLAPAAERAAAGVRVRLYDAASVSDVQKFLAQAPKGRGRVTLQLELDGGEEAEMELPGAWQLSETVKADLRALGGGLDVSEY